MTALNGRLRIREMLFFFVLVLMSGSIHLLILLAVDINYKPFEKRRAERRLMRIDFMAGSDVKAARPLTSRPTPEPRQGPPKAPATKEVVAVPARPTPEEQAAEEEEIPETFSKFLEGLTTEDYDSGSLFRGDSYDVLGDGIVGGDPGKGPSVDSMGMMREALDNRVQMVVNSYPSTPIEHNYSFIPYPELRIKRKDYQAGWTSVYIEIFIDSRGRIDRLKVLRPEIPNELEQVFVDAVLSTVLSWKFSGEKAEIHVDVRFYVE